MREKRKSRSGKEHLIQNLKAKQGMASFKEEGRITDFATRAGGKVGEMRDWELFLKAGKNAERLLSNKKPDIVEQINAKVREQKERERKQEEIVKENGGEWLYSGEMGEWYWSGDSEPVVDNFEHETYSDGELEQIREHENQEVERVLAEKREKLRKARQLINEQRKEALAIPVDPLPEREPCAYERYRENNIREREEAMAECGFFDDLASFKSEIGLVKESVVEDKKHKSSDENGKDIKNIKKGKKGDKKQNKLERKQTYLKSGSNEEAGEVVDEANVDKAKIFIPAGSQKPWYENFKIDEWHLHDCLE